LVAFAAPVSSAIRTLSSVAEEEQDEEDTADLEEEVQSIKAPVSNENIGFTADAPDAGGTGGTGGLVFERGVDSKISDTNAMASSCRHTCDFLARDVASPTSAITEPLTKYSNLEPTPKHIQCTSPTAIPQ
jgi:hypothetical protein